MTVTQTEIDSAVLLAKSSLYTLGGELALEKKYGGNIDCCFRKMELIWSWLDALVCEKQAVTGVESTGAIELTSLHLGDTVEIKVGGFSLTGPQLVISTNVDLVMAAVPAVINAYQSLYVASFGVYKGNGKSIILINGGCANRTITFTPTFVDTPSAAICTGMEDGVCEVKANHCLTDEKIKKLIHKINSLCSQV